MFWRFGGFANTSTLDAILDKDDVTLEDLLDESDLIQELKQHNTKLIEYLRDDAVLRKLLEYVIAPRRPDATISGLSGGGEGGREHGEGSRDQNGQEDVSEDEREKQEKSRLKYAYISCEVLSSENWSLSESLMDNLPLLRMFWGFLERPSPLDPLQAGYFTKVNETLLDKKTEEMMDFFRSLDGIVPKILKHVDCPMIMDLLLKIISMEKCEGGQGIVDWLQSQNLIPLLLSFLSPEYPATTQTSTGDFLKAIITISANASQNEQSCIGPNDLTRQLVSDACIRSLIADMLKGGNPLTVGVGIVIEVIRKNNSDYDPDVGAGVDSIPSGRDPIYLGTLLRLFATHVPDFMRLILTQSLIITNEDGTKTEKKRELKAAFGGTIEPLGFDRFKTCELMAELLHCSNMGLLNEKGSERYIKERDRERDRLKAERERERILLEGGDPNSVNEGVVVEKTPLQVQNGGVEVSDDGMNEDEFEDVAVSGLLEEFRRNEAARYEMNANMSTDSKSLPEAELKAKSKMGESMKDVEDEDVFVDEPLSPPTRPVDSLTVSDASAQVYTTPVPAPILADEIPLLDTTPNLTPLWEPSPPSPTSAGLTAKLSGLKLNEDCDSKMEEIPPPAPSEMDKSNEEKRGGKTKEDVVKTDIPRAPSPPPSFEDDDDTPLKGSSSLVADLKSSSVPAPLSPLNSKSPSVLQERMDAELPPLPTEDSKCQRLESASDENLMDLSGDFTDSKTSIAGNVSITSHGSDASSIIEYQSMIERDYDGNPVVGDFLKMNFVEHAVVPTILDFFFRFPWNNFLHNVVYDVVQQVFNGSMDKGYNRALAIDLFVTGCITERIVEGQQASDEVQAKKNIRLGYMGHLTLIAEEVVKFAERHPPEILGSKVLGKVSDPVWVQYVEETLANTRERDNAILGGVRPEMTAGPKPAVINAVQQGFNSNSQSAGGLTLSSGVSVPLDTIDLGNVNGANAGVGSGSTGAGAGGLLSGFGSSSDEEDEDMEHDDDDDEVARLGLSGSSDQFATYISQEITNVDKFGSSDEDDDDDVDVGVDVDGISFSSGRVQSATVGEAAAATITLAPLNIVRRTTTTTGVGAVVGGSGAMGQGFEAEEVDEFTGDVDSSDDDEDDEDEDELLGGSLLARRRGRRIGSGSIRRRPTSTHEATTRESLVDDEDDDEDEFLNAAAAGVRGLSLKLSAEIGVGEFYSKAGGGSGGGKKGKAEGDEQKAGDGHGGK